MSTSGDAERLSGPSDEWIEALRTAFEVRRGTRLDPWFLREIVREADAAVRGERGVGGPTLVNGYDARFWNESYAMVRDAVLEHLKRFVQEDDVAEEAIIVDAIARAGKHADDGELLPNEFGKPSDAGGVGGPAPREETSK